VAQAVGITSVKAEALPADKVLVIEELQRGGKATCMVGDGVNDAPALAAADLGIAVSAGADSAMEAADVTLVGGDLHGVASALGLSREVMRVIRQNLFWAFVYNI